MTKSMCVVLVYFLTLRMSIFENFMLDDKLVTLLTKHHVIKAEHVQMKSNRILSDITIGRNYAAWGYHNKSKVNILSAESLIITVA